MEGAAPDPSTITMVRPNQKFNQDDLFLMKLSQVVMLCIGFASIWIAIGGIAFDEDATNQNFLVLFVGGLTSFAFAIGLIEVQSKKNGYQLHDIQNYFLGIAFFFSTVGVVWGSRFLMGYATGTLDLDLFGDPELYQEVDWSPNANGIYVQTLAILVLTLGHFRLLKRYSGDTSFGWGVATYAPMVLLLAGVGPWIRWSESVVSWELGIAIVAISFSSMEMALRSNRAFNFVIVAVAAGIVPIMYEMLNSNAPEGGAGGALSLMVFTIGLQGYYAARPDLRKEVMERASAVLIGTVVIAIFVARASPEFNLILGPLRVAEQPELSNYLNIPVALWITVLFAYFPAVLQQRVPWMPIGLAVALVALPQETSTLPWVLSMIVVPYMIFISKVARAWVINIALLAFSASYLLSDYIGMENGLSAQDTFGGTWLHVLIPIFIVAVSEGGRRTEKIETSTSLAMLGSVILSRAVLDPEWFLPWLLIAYMCAMNFSMMIQTPNPSLKQRKDLTLALAFTSVTILLLGFLDNLKLPPTDAFDAVVEIGLRPQFLVLSLVMFALSAKAARRELDIGALYAWLSAGNEGELMYNAKTSAWEVRDESLRDFDQIIREATITPLARFSLLTSLMLFTFTVSDVTSSTWSSQPLLVLLMALPVGVLIREVVAMESISSATRATAVTLLILIAAPLSLSLGPDLWGSNGGINTATLLLDAILVSAPLIVNAVIARRGLDINEASRGSDAVTYSMLLLLGMLDTSGGLLLIPMMVLVTWRVLQYHFYWLLACVPFVFILLGDGWFEHGLFQEILAIAPDTVAAYMVDAHAGPFAAFIGLFVSMQMILGLSGLLTYKSDEPESTVVLFGMGLWLIFGLFSIIPDGYWAPTLGCMFLIPYFWYTNNSKVLPYMLGVLFVSLYIGFEMSDTFQPLDQADAWGWSGVITGFAGSTMAIMHSYGTLFRDPPTTDEEIGLADSTAELATQLAALAFVAGYSVFFGVGPVIGLVLLGRSALSSGRPNSIIALPILLTFSVVNLMAQSEIGSDDQRQSVTGLALAVQGILLTLLSAKDDLVYDYETVTWESDDAFFAFMDRLGISGALYSIIGLFIMFDSLNLESMAYLLTTVYLVLLGIQGYSDEADARWRRGVGGYGSILTSYLFSQSLNTELYSNIGLLLMALVALGFAFMVMQRMNEDDGIYEETPAAPPIQPRREEPPQPKEAEPSVEIEEEDDVVVVDERSDAEMEAEVLEMLEELVDEDDAIELLDEEPEEEPEEKPEEEHVEIADPEPVKAPAKKSKKAPAKKPATASAKAPEKEPPSHNGLLDTGEGFALRLPQDAVDNILSSLDQTPHEGYVPVVAFGPNGQIVLTFETPNADA